MSTNVLHSCPESFYQSFDRKGGQPWTEAKYYQLACLAKLDAAAASKAFKQYQLLYPNLGGPEWKGRFQALGKNLP